MTSSASAGQSWASALSIALPRKRARLYAGTTTDALGNMPCSSALSGLGLSSRPAEQVGQAGASASCMEAANASGPCSAAAGSIHMTCQPWPSRSKKLREYMKP